MKTEIDINPCDSTARADTGEKEVVEVTVWHHKKTPSVDGDVEYEHEMAYSHRLTLAEAIKVRERLSLIVRDKLSSFGLKELSILELNILREMARQSENNMLKVVDKSHREAILSLSEKGLIEYTDKLGQFASCTEYGARHLHAYGAVSQ